MIFLLESPEVAEPLFKGWEESLIWSCLQGVMGELYVDDRAHPSAVMAILGDFCFFAGEPCEELVRSKPTWCRQDFMIMVPQNDRWGDLIKFCYGTRATEVTRYAIKKERGIFDKEKLERIAEAVPDGFEVKLIDEEVYHWSREREWCKDWASHYDTYEEFRDMGLGVVVTKDGIPVAGASSYSTFRDGIEIEINTKEEYRRRGLASVCGARLILECMKRDLYPSWDAQNKWSVTLAEKLGYHFSHEYSAYEIWGY